MLWRRFLPEEFFTFISKCIYWKPTKIWHKNYTILRNKKRRWFGAAPPPPPSGYLTSANFTQQIIYRWKGNLMASTIHFKCEENILICDFMSDFRDFGQI